MIAKIFFQKSIFKISEENLRIVFKGRNNETNLTLLLEDTRVVSLSQLQMERSDLQKRRNEHLRPSPVVNI